MNVPNHVAIILDGNGRWAKAKGLPRTAGHVQGAKTVEQICEDAYNMGINYLTIYAFSTENWTRSDSEVATLMNLLRNYMKNSIKRAQKNNMCVPLISALRRQRQGDLCVQGLLGLFRVPGQPGLHGETLYTYTHININTHTDRHLM